MARPSYQEQNWMRTHGRSPTVAEFNALKEMREPTMARNFDRLSIRPGEMTEMEIGFSEVACHLGVAGKTMLIKLLDNGKMVQLYDDEGFEFSMPITYGEAGIYRDNAGYYHY